ncbi:Hsp70 family protein [Planctomonas sp. JC2975]|nr:Hsp70 family protein [Planctomonas sp. JC2975]
MAASYYLAVDVGTSRTAAATSRLAADGSLVTASVPLGRNSDNVPTSMFVTNSDLLFGDAAERRGITEPQRLVREFKRRVGDGVPLIAGDRRFRPEEVFALMVGWVVDSVSAREARLPSAIAVTVPAAWGEYRRQLIHDALAHQGWASVTLVSEPEAAARHYVTTTELPAGRALVVYDLGGGTFDAIVLRREPNGDIRVVGIPTGLEDVGGADFDDAVLRHAIAVGGVSGDELSDIGDDRIALAAFRRECVDAKEALSFDSEAVVPLLVGSGRGTVRITRAEFEQMIEEQISRTADVLADGISASGVALKDVDAILLTGGSSRIPRVSQLLSERFNRRIAIDADPKAIIALGAVRILSDRAGLVVAAPVSAEADVEEEEETAAVPPAAGPTAPVAATPPRAGIFGRKRRAQTMAFAAAGTVALALGLAIPAATNRDRGAVSLTSSVLEKALGIGSAHADPLPSPPQPTAAPAPPPLTTASGSGSPDSAFRTPTASRSTSKGSSSTKAVGPTPSSSKSATAADAMASSQAGTSGSDPTPTADPTPTDPPTTDPAPTDPPTSDPTPTDPPTTDPTPTDPPTTDPTDPPSSDPAPTDSSVPDAGS